MNAQTVTSDDAGITRESLKLLRDVSRQVARVLGHADPSDPGYEELVNAGLYLCGDFAEFVYFATAPAHDADAREVQP